MEAAPGRPQRPVQVLGLVLRPLPLPVAGGRLAAGQVRVRLRTEDQEALRLWGVPSEHRANLKIHIPGVLDYDIAQPEIAHLHTVGLARDYDVRGSSKMRKKP